MRVDRMEGLLVEDTLGEGAGLRLGWLQSSGEFQEMLAHQYTPNLERSFSLVQVFLCIEAASCKHWGLIAH